MVREGKKKATSRRNRTLSNKTQKEKERAVREDNSQNLGSEIKDFVGATRESGISTSRFICKVCGNGFDDQDLLKRHIDQLHEQKRTVTASEVIRKVFGGRVNFPKTKAEIVRYVEENKDRESVTPDIVDTIRNIPDRLYNDEADFILGLRQQRGESIAT